MVLDVNKVSGSAWNVSVLDMLESIESKMSRAAGCWLNVS